MLEKDILFNAVENLKKLVQLPIVMLESDARLLVGNGKVMRYDAVLKIGDGKEYIIEVKRAVHKSNLPTILEQLSQLLIDFPLLVAQSISASAKKILQSKNISYLDMAGNCFINNNQGLYIQIEGKKLAFQEGKRKHLAFNKNGIKLIYALLLQEDLLNQSYSVIAESANISKSTVGNILEDLKEKKYILQLNKTTRKLTNKKELQEKWVQAFNERFKPTLLRGTFRFLSDKERYWKEINLGATAFWGGEPAADILTEYLSPGEWIIYTNQSKADFLQNLSLVPDPNKGNVKVYSIFWENKKECFVHPSKQIVNPFLVYADLIGTADNRNFETAIKIYEQYLSAHFAE